MTSVSIGSASARESNVLTTEDVARLCGVSIVTVNRWVKSGRLPTLTPFNPYRRRQAPYRIRREDVERLAQPVQRAG